MGDSLLTRASLLARLGDQQDGGAWREFVELYGGLVYGFARNHGLQDADAADLTQEVLLALAGTVGRWQYDPQQGTFRGWLFGLTRHKLARFLQQRQKQPVGSGDTGAHRLLDEQPAAELAPETAWEEEFQRQLFRLAGDHVREKAAPTTWQAFWRTAVEGKSGAAVAAELGLSVGAVYVARSRVLARLVEEIERLRAE
jgi:RNA polymerase sigma factor (sigma-70 family)